MWSEHAFSGPPCRKGFEQWSANTLRFLNLTGQCDRNTAHPFALVGRFNERKDLDRDIWTDG